MADRTKATGIERRLKVEPFNKAAHDRSRFDCGHPVLNAWIQKLVSQFERRDLARTYVLVEAGHSTESGAATILGYDAISNHSVVYDSLPEDQAKGIPQIDVPVVLLGRLAIDRAMQGQGLGEFLLIDVLRRAEYLSTQIAVRAVEVDASDEPARQFYLRYGFTPFRDDPHHLFLPMNIIRRLKLPPLKSA